MRESSPSVSTQSCKVDDSEKPARKVTDESRGCESSLAEKFPLTPI